MEDLEGMNDMNVVIIINHSAMTCEPILTEAEMLYQLLLNEKYSCYIYIPNEINVSPKNIEKDRMEELIQQENTVVIYYHSVYWEEGLQVLKRVKGKIVFRYFHISSPDLIESYSPSFALQCKMGQKQMMDFEEIFRDAYWIADSGLSLEDLNKVSENRKAISPIFNNAEKLAGIKPDESVLRNLLESEEVNILFVGELFLNEKRLNILNALRIYVLNYGKKIKWRVIKKNDEIFKSYEKSVVEFLDDFNLTGVVEFIEGVNDSELLSYYLASDLLLCVSNNESICVSIAEAQYFGLPVIALENGAIREMLGESQIILQDDYSQFAAAIYIISHSTEYQKYLIENGWRNFQDRFSYQKISARFMDEFMKGIGERT